jgi:ribonuclease HI
MLKGKGIPDEDALNIYTDGSSLPLNKRNAGVGFYFVWANESGDEETEAHCPLGWQSATSDEMELKACSLAIKEANNFFPDLIRFERILVFSDSRYVVNNYPYAKNVWPKRGWRNQSNGLSVENIDLWKELTKETNRCLIDVDFDWVKAHKKNPHNRVADDLATESASKPFNKPITVSGTARSWTDRKTKQGCIPMLGQVTKIRIVSWEYRRRDKVYKYRYEIIDPDDKNYKDADFLYYSEIFSRHDCYQVRLNSEQSKPSIVEILCKLDPADYKY